MKSIKYFPFGEGWESQGNLPEQQFTGQRLDSTGLYYYGARYYDPHIGRFISPDTIVPQPFNPQSLNRYSYCLNNPLKYIDPTGHEVNIYGVDMETLADMKFSDALRYVFSTVAASDLSNYQAMFAAWNTLAGVAPELTGYLLDSTEIVNISLENPDNMNGSGHCNMNGTGILLDENWENNSDILAVLLAHEALHSAFRLGGGYFTDSILEEALCYSMQYTIEMKLTGKCDNSTAVQCKDINPDLTIYQIDDITQGIIADFTYRGVETALSDQWVWHPIGWGINLSQSLLDTASLCWPK